MTRKLKNEELKRLSPAAFKSSNKHRVVIILDNVRSLHNVGSAFRTADCFRIEQIMLCGITGKPPDREIEKTALGATQTVAWQHFASTAEAISFCRNNGYSIFAVEQAEQSTSLEHFRDKTGKIALVFGNEIYGVDQKIVDAADGVIEIPQYGTKHSLNVAVSIGIVMWEMIRAPQN